MASMQQEQQQQQSKQHHPPPPPPSYADHDPASLRMPAVPKHDIGSTHHTGVHLPDLHSLGLPEHEHEHEHASSLSSDASHATQLRNAHPLSPNLKPITNVTAWPAVADVDSPMDLASQMSMDDLRHRDLSVSMDDADVRMAAEALSGLGNPDFLRSPRTTTSFPSYTSSLHEQTTTTHSYVSNSPQSPPQELEPEPLLRLITDSHPWLGNTISGSMIAYDGAKHYSPRFVRGTAEFMERNIGSPMVSTVGFVSRQTGVDGRIRRYLGDRRLSDDGRSGPNNKRRRVTGPASYASKEEDVEQGLKKGVEVFSPSTEENRVRADSRASHHSGMSGFESLPAYDDHRSPHYEELSPQVSKLERPSDATEPSTDQAQQRSLTSQVLETTAGLGVALSESSLRSLKYSLSVLRGANDHIGTIMRALKTVLEEYEQDQKCEDLLSANEKHTEGLNGSNSVSAAQEERSRRLAKRIKELGDSIWDVLRQTIGTISRYTGSALPENAASLVRRQLMSLPLRWRNAATSSRSGSTASSSGSSQLEAQGESQIVMGATRMMNFGKESLEMLSQVSLVVSGTINSAELWLDSLGRQKRQDSGAVGEIPGQPQLRLQHVQSPPHNGNGTIAGQRWKVDVKEVS